MTSHGSCVRKNLSSFLFAVFSALVFCSCGETPDDGVRVKMCIAKRISTLDPALAADTVSQFAVSAFYDTLLQYKTGLATHELEPSMLVAMPVASKDMTSFVCTLRNDLYFAPSPVFNGVSASNRKVTSRDVVFSLKRLADPRIHSTGYWLVRNTILGIEDFHRAAENAAKDDMSVYDLPCEGLRIIDERSFEIRTSAPSPNLAYLLAVPYTSIVSRSACEKLGNDLSSETAGSGPFIMEKWERDHVLELVRNNSYKVERLNGEARPLPLADRISCYVMRQPTASWLAFLQGNLDFIVLDADRFEGIVGRDMKLSPALSERGIKLESQVQLETNYVGFSFTDPVLADNHYLRAAICLAFNKEKRMEHSCGKLIPAYGPLPPGVKGYDASFRGKYGRRNVALAKEYMAKAGYKDGIDPKTGKNLVLTFDQAGSDTACRQTAELFANDMREIGIKIVPSFNTRPRFMQKLSTGSVSLFRFSWTADYPDAENFFQLFYGKNAGGCNRVSYRNKDYDGMFEKLSTMPASEERTLLCRKMTEYLESDCPWIFESHTNGFMLRHEWTRNAHPDEMIFNRWKYFTVDPGLRERRKSLFTPIGMGALR